MTTPPIEPLSFLVHQEPKVGFPKYLRASEVHMNMMTIFLAVAWVAVLAAGYFLAVRFLKKFDLL